jgi:hypothetical protein
MIPTVTFQHLHQKPVKKLRHYRLTDNRILCIKHLSRAPPALSPTFNICLGSKTLQCYPRNLLVIGGSQLKELIMSSIVERGLGVTPVEVDV